MLYWILISFAPVKIVQFASAKMRISLYWLGPIKVLIIISHDFFLLKILFSLLWNTLLSENLNLELQDCRNNKPQMQPVFPALSVHVVQLLWIWHPSESWVMASQERTRLKVSVSARKSYFVTVFEILTRISWCCMWQSLLFAEMLPNWRTVSSWGGPQQTEGMDLLEQDQRRGTKINSWTEHLSCDWNVKELRLFSWQKRFQRGLIEAFSAWKGLWNMGTGFSAGLVVIGWGVLPIVLYFHLDGTDLNTRASYLSQHPQQNLTPTPNSIRLPFDVCNQYLPGLLACCHCSSSITNPVSKETLLEKICCKSCFS